jgi:hypothetical protein
MRIRVGQRGHALDTHFGIAAQLAAEPDRELPE